MKVVFICFVNIKSVLISIYFFWSMKLVLAFWMLRNVTLILRRMTICTRQVIWFLWFWSTNVWLILIWINVVPDCAIAIFVVIFFLDDIGLCVFKSLSLRQDPIPQPLGFFGFSCLRILLWSFARNIFFVVIKHLIELWIEWLRPLFHHLVFFLGSTYVSKASCCC